MVPPEAASAAVSAKLVTPGPKLTGPTATSVLAKLKVKGKAPATGYSRAKFGSGWKDPDGNKCDARQDMLNRDMSKVKFKDKKKCAVSSGTLNDLYTGKKINWKLKANSVDIDHMVALKNAWISGAQQLSSAQRVSLSNDPLNLMASDASANRSKGDKNTAEWLPKNKDFRCQYVATQISVKHKYALSVTAPEKAAMAKVLKSCPKQKTAKVTPIKPGGKAPAKVAPKKTAPKPAPKKAAPKSATVHPGAYCSTKNAKGTSKAGKKYTCKTSKTESRLRWRA